MIAEFDTRAPVTADAAAVTELIVTCDIDEYGTPDFELDDLLVDWRRPSFDPAQDARVVLADERIVAYAILLGDSLADGYVHPDYRGRGIGSALVRWLEERAVHRLSPGATGHLGQVMSSVNERARRLFESLGYRPARTYWRMVMPLEEPPPRPEWPAGVRVRTFDVERDTRAVHALIQDAFGDNERHIPESFEEWEAGQIDREAFEPGLWFVAESDGRIVGAIVCPNYESEGWVRQLAIARDWRRRGLGTALLRQAMVEFRRRGRSELGLVVDSWNRTGAKEMYERAGMRVAREHVRYEKELRALS